MNSALAILRAEQHISVSAITSYLRCPMAHAHRYIHKTTPSHRPGVLAFGSAIHTALALFYSRLMEGQLEPSAEELAASFADAWRRQFDGDIPVLLDGKATPDSLKDKGVEMIKVFHEQAPRPRKVIGVEEPFSIEILDPHTGTPFTERLVGVFDAVVQAEDNTHRILEHKTAARRWGRQRLEHDLQVTAYSMAAPMVGLPNASVTLQVLLKTKQPALEVYHPTRTDRDRRDLLHLVSGVLCAIKVGAFYPSREWWCSGCPYAGPCIAG